MDNRAKLIPQKYIDLIEKDNNETVVCMIRRHPIGLVGVYLTGLLIALIVVFGTAFLGAAIDSQNEVTGAPPIQSYIALVGILFGIVIGFFTYIAAYVYQNSVILVTTDKIAQIIYKNLVDRKVSQLSLGDLQDVTVDQNGIFARVFKYGTLVIETAGEQNNFTFNYTPNPYSFAKEIVGAREESIKKYGN